MTIWIPIYALFSDSCSKIDGICYNGSPTNFVNEIIHLDNAISGYNTDIK